MIRQLRDLVPSHVLTLLVTEAALVFCSFVLACYLILDVDPVVYLLYDGGVGKICLIGLTLLVGIYLHDLYSEIQVRSRILLIQQGLQIVGMAILAQALFGYVNPNLILPRWVVVLGSGLSLLCFVSWRLVYSGVMLRAIGEERILFLGWGAIALDISRHLEQHPELGMLVIGRTDDEQDHPAPGGGPARLGGTADLRQVVADTKPDRIVVVGRERRGNVPLTDLLDLRFAGIRVEEVGATFERVFKRISPDELLPAQLIYSGEPGPRRRSIALQFGYSGLIALAGVVLCAPLMLIVAVAIKLTSGGPVLCRQTRVGWQGRRFTLLTFRSAHEKAEPAVSPVARWLRRSRLDQLPQLFNVLRGDMSIFGPRPESPEADRRLAQRIPFYRYRLGVRPGMTGWAQVHLAGSVREEETVLEFGYDLYYIQNMNLSLDAYVLLDTLRRIVIGPFRAEA